MDVINAGACVSVMLMSCANVFSVCGVDWNSAVQMKPLSSNDIVCQPMSNFEHNLCSNLNFVLCQYACCNCLMKNFAVFVSKPSFRDFSR